MTLATSTMRLGNRSASGALMSCSASPPPRGAEPEPYLLPVPESEETESEPYRLRVPAAKGAESEPGVGSESAS
eukprot:15469856-Alexandrium_andersonii.AAC.1